MKASFVGRSRSLPVVSLLSLLAWHHDVVKQPSLYLVSLQERAKQLDPITDMRLASRGAIGSVPMCWEDGDKPQVPHALGPAMRMARTTAFLS